MESALCHGSAKDESALIDELGRFPLLSAMFDRRSRRFDVGMSIPDGPFAYQSSRPPLPLSDLEGTLLVLCGAGVSGWHLGMEHTTSGDPHLGCNYPVRLTRRVAASAAGIETSELIVSDDSGTVITRFRDLDLIGEVAQYLHDTFGKFPATIPSVYVRMYA